jgi:hypothetical protein
LNSNFHKWGRLIRNKNPFSLKGKKKKNFKNVILNRKRKPEKYNEHKILLSIIKDKIRIILFMIRENISNCKFNSIQQLIDSISNTYFLKSIFHNSSYSFNEFLIIIYNTYKKIIQTSISTFKYYGIITDES